MDNYKIAALNNYFQRKNFKFALPLFYEPNSHYRLIFAKSLPIYARYARSFQELQQGLMYVDRLASDEGCLLDFGQEQYVNLWMKNCKLNLQAAFLDKYGTILEIKNMYYLEPTTLHHSTNIVRYALEMPEHFFTSHNINIGDSIKLDIND